MLSAKKAEVTSQGVASVFFIRKEGFEQGGSEAEENSLVDCFCRRANEQSEAKEATASEKSLALRQKLKSPSSDGLFYF